MDCQEKRQLFSRYDFFFVLWKIQQKLSAVFKSLGGEAEVRNKRGITANCVLETLEMGCWLVVSIVSQRKGVSDFGLQKWLHFCFLLKIHHNSEDSLKNTQKF